MTIFIHQLLDYVNQNHYVIQKFYSKLNKKKNQLILKTKMEIIEFFNKKIRTKSKEKNAFYYGNKLIKHFTLEFYKNLLKNGESIFI